MASTKASNTSSGDRRVRRTRAALARALIHLVEEQDLSRISVSDVAEGAGVSRSAFYDHYRDVHELAEAACTALIDGLIESLPSPGPDSPDLAREAIESLGVFYSTLAEHAGLFRALLGPQGSARVIDHIRRRIVASIHDRQLQATAGDRPGPARALADAANDVPAAFTAGAVIGVATDWLLRGCPEPPAEMAAVTWPLLNALYRVDAYENGRRDGG